MKDPMFVNYDKVREPYVTGPCPFNQTLCQRVADGRNGDAMSDCPICKPYAIDVRQRHYQLPAIRQCYCGYSLEQHKDNMPCATLGCIQY